MKPTVGMLGTTETESFSRLGRGGRVGGRGRRWCYHRCPPGRSKPIPKTARLGKNPKLLPNPKA
ncbi:hypothetical protein C1H46_025898 [Malus baccata]|uniref:Uncharacterized protein n=1 Tax=Malus baccata TaxID=106549 RepID=A0A540LQJ8_MALBA|nr:hypothetical protein C1H46_025898 [Malus baccata]